MRDPKGLVGYVPRIARSFPAVHRAHFCSRRARARRAWGLIPRILAPNFQKVKTLSSYLVSYQSANSSQGTHAGGPITAANAARIVSPTP